MSTQTQLATNDVQQGILIAFADKKGSLHSLTLEGAVFKGGKVVMDQIKDAMMNLALLKAGNGKYRAAVDVLSVAFPKVAKAYSTLYAGKDPWQNKAAFTAFVDACIVHKAPEKGWSTKQAQARILLSALSKLLTATEAKVTETVES